MAFPCQSAIPVFIRNQLFPKKYKANIEIHFAARPAPDGQRVPLWPGDSIMTNPAEFEDQAMRRIRQQRNNPREIDYTSFPAFLTTIGSSTTMRVPLPSLLLMVALPPSSLARLADSRQTEAAFANVVGVEADAPIPNLDAKPFPVLHQSDQHAGCSCCGGRRWPGPLG